MKAWVACQHHVMASPCSLAQTDRHQLLVNSTYAGALVVREAAAWIRACSRSAHRQTEGKNSLYVEVG